MNTLLVSYDTQANKDNFIAENEEILKDYYIIWARNDTVVGVHVMVIQE